MSPTTLMSKHTTLRNSVTTFLQSLTGFSTAEDRENRNDGFWPQTI